MSIASDTDSDIVVVRVTKLLDEASGDTAFRPNVPANSAPIAKSDFIFTELCDTHTNRITAMSLSKALSKYEVEASESQIADMLALHGTTQESIEKVLQECNLAI